MKVDQPVGAVELLLVSIEPRPKKSISLAEYNAYVLNGAHVISACTQCPERVHAATSPFGSFINLFVSAL